MGQDVTIKATTRVGDVLIVDTDRSFTGQDGQAIRLGEPGEGVPGDLADRLFDLGVGIDYVYILQNAITVRRPAGWDDDTASEVERVTNQFLRYYSDEEE